MILILSNISFEELKAKPDMKQYAVDCDYFSLIKTRTKSEAALQMTGWVNWYVICCNVPLYITVLTDKYWKEICGSFAPTVRFTTWKTVPRYVEELNREDGKYFTVPANERLCSEKKVESVAEEIIRHNFKNEPVYTERLGKTNI